jgi:GTPase SAR1 family protein
MNENKNKIGVSFLIVGRQGSGKSPIAKRLAANSGFKNKVVLDIRNEYSHDDFTIFTNIEIFRKKLIDFKNTFIIIEEATIFLMAYKQQDVASLLVGIQHNRCVCVFLFHSLLDVPDYILRLSNYMILLPTNDEPEKVRTMRPKFYNYLSQNKKEDIYIDLNTI